MDLFSHFEAQYADYQVNDPFAKASSDGNEDRCPFEAFNAQADAIHRHVKAVLNPSTAEEIMQQMAEQTCRRIEKAALAKRFSLFGALQFESDVRAICSFFTSVSEQEKKIHFQNPLEILLAFELARP